MDKQFKNLFPATIYRGAFEIFGKQAMQSVLLELLSAGTVTEQAQNDLSFCKLLHPNEVATLSGYKLPKRRSEYLTGRVCAKMAIQDFLSPSQIPSKPNILSEIEILNGVNGRPKVHIHTDQADDLKMDISISHCGDYGVALAAEAKCGIDLQRQEAALLRVKDRYCSENEFRLLEDFLPDNDTATKLTILWAAKEAAKKALSYWQMPGFLDLGVYKLEKSQDYIALSFHTPETDNQQTPKGVKVVAVTFGDYALAICLINEESSDAGTPRS
jgi:4'-phosphopantetheinyl transferase EntD